MEKIQVKIKNCYGINCLESEFDFSNNKSTHVIYAPNGVMKTSFANVFDDYSKDIESKDLIHPSRKPTRIILDINGKDIDKELICVIRPYEKTYKSEKMSTLLANEELRKKYDDIHKNIDIEKNKLMAELKKSSGLKKNIEEEIVETFAEKKDSIFTAIEKVEQEVLDANAALYGHISYAIIFDEKVVSFLETGEFKKQIKKYIEKYDELISNSTFLKKGFNHYNASTIHKNLNENGFFAAEHSINLNHQGTKKEVSNEKEFIKIINDEKEKILNDSELKKIFDAIDKKITNEQLRAFREYLFSNKDILPELDNLEKFKRKLWISYFKLNKELYENLLTEYRIAQKEINNIIEKAKKQKTDWEDVIKIFNRRFYVPFKLEIKNKEDAILRDITPSIHYYFEDRQENVEEDLLLRVLSQGEKRALYLLNIIFEIESRKKKGAETLFIIDDIADSFDYKNKYAILEYLKEISENSEFASIILTHNFDFFRTLQDRVGMNKWENSSMALKDKDQIYLEKLKYKYISSPFKNWKKNLDNPVKLIASVTFARNITEYIGDDETFNKLTSILHMKDDTLLLTVKDLENIYKEIFKDLKDLTLADPNKKIFDLIFELAEKLSKESIEVGLNLENKVVLSIAIRLSAENFMISRINDTNFRVQISSDQTGKLFGRFKKDFSSESENIEVLEKVNLMTPENIHLNSFMFEPILDISDFHLKQLYNDVISLSSEEQISVDQVAATIADTNI